MPKSVNIFSTPQAKCQVQSALKCHFELVLPQPLPSLLHWGSLNLVKNMKLLNWSPLESSPFDTITCIGKYCPPDLMKKLVLNKLKEFSSIAWPYLEVYTRVHYLKQRAQKH